MAICPNCGQKTSGDYCQFCNYPILRPSTARRQRALEAGRAREAEKKANEYLEEIESIYEKLKEEIKKAREAEKEAREKAEREAEERAREEAQKELPAEEKEEVAAAVEETKVDLYIRDMESLLTLPMDLEKVKHLEGYLEEIESTSEELKTGKVSSKEAIQKLRDISARLSK